MSVDEFGVHLGFIYIRFYALILMSGMGLAAWLTAWRAARNGLDPEQVWNGLLWAIVPGVIGARLYHVFTPTPNALAPDGSGPLTIAWYLSHPWEILFIWHGGLGIYGGIIGGAIGVYAYCRRYKEPLLRWLDLIAPALALAQAIGRWGNLVNHELYGRPTTLPWAIYIPPINRLPGFEQDSMYHPLFLYESLWNVGTCLFLLWLARRFRDRLRDGDILLAYLMCYATIRFFLDFVRLDSNGFGPITTAQMVSLLAFIVAGLVMLVRHRLPPRPVNAQPDVPPAR